MINTLNEALAIVEDDRTMERRFEVWARDVQRDASVGDWQTVTAFTNSWVNFDTATFNAAEFRSLGDKRVELRGLVKDGTIGDSMFTLPEGFRPVLRYIFAVQSNNTIGRVDVLDDGTVIPFFASNVFVSLDGIIFSLD